MPKKIEIEIIDSILCRIDSFNEKIIEPCLSYKSVYWKQGRYKKDKFEYLKKCFTKTKGKNIYFYTGYLPRIRQYLKSIDYSIKLYKDNLIHVPFSLKKADKMVNRETGKKITLMDHQKELLSIALTQQRGVIKSATGTGKSYIILAMLHCIPKEENILILCHSVSIVKQLFEEFKLYRKSIIMLGGDAEPNEMKTIFKKRIIISTIQTFAKISPKNYQDYFSAVIVDECHRVSSIEGNYGTVLSNLLAPVRIGFTATPPTAMKAVFAYEGLLGPVIGEVSINEAAKENLLAKPKLKIIKAGFPPGVRDIRDYHSVYYEGIVNNKTRNTQIVEIIRECQFKEETVLIFVNKIEHGNNILSLGDELGVEIVFVQGASTMEVRERIKYELEHGIIKAVVATSVWKEGVNIPSLNNVINAGGGKSEIQTLQSIGRALRLTQTKKVVNIYDFFDHAHPYLISHFGERLCLYMENEWL